jgi:hypothetical protein
MRLPRFRIWAIMLLVAGCAIGLRLVVVWVAIRNQDKSKMMGNAWHYHDGLSQYARHFGTAPVPFPPPEPVPDMRVELHRSPFWPRYWRRVLHLPWPGSYVCPENQQSSPDWIEL